MPQDIAFIADAPTGLQSQAAAPRLLSVATATPPIAFDQAAVARRATGLFDRAASDIARLLPVFEHAGIATRYSCVPLDWYMRDHGWAERQRLYTEHALILLERAAREAVVNAGLDFAEIDAIVTVSTTGIATPSLDARLMARLPFRRDVARLPIFGLGCAGGVLGLARGAALARAAPGSRVLVLVVELCMLTFRHGDQSKSNIVAAALFGDGAAAAVIGPARSSPGPGGAGHGAPAPAFGPAGEYTWPDSLDVMGWHVEDDGLGVLFSRDIPQLVRTLFRDALDGFLAGHKMRIDLFDAFVCHPGGAKVIDALEDIFALPRGGLAAAREVLRDYGNMSAVTVLFVLERMLREGPPAQRYLLTALGPGFTGAFLTLDRDP